MVDTDGRDLVLQLHPADVRDRDGAIPLLKASRRRFPFVELAYVDTADAAKRAAAATSIAIEAVRKIPGRSALRPIRAAGWSSAASRGSIAIAIGERLQSDDRLREHLSSTLHQPCC